MKFQVITLFPELITAGTSSGVLSQGIKKNLLSVSTINPREFATDGHRTVDDRPFGGGDGMLMLPEILEASVAKAREAGPTRVIYLSPQGPVLTTEKVRELSRLSSVTLVCGRYGGIDQRALNVLVDEELSIGDYVISGGELAALVAIDAVSRFLPGVLGHEASAEKDSFSNGILEHPNFTRPRDWQGQSVPEILLSGNHPKIDQWRRHIAILVTLQKRPELLGAVSKAEIDAAKAFAAGLSPADKEACGLDGLGL